MEDNNVLVVAFDGLDLELADKFELKNILQSEFGRIDNHTGMSSIKTSELFASFITGNNYEEHGVRELETTYREKKLANKLVPDFFLNNIRGVYRLKEAFKTILGVDRGRRYSRENLESDSLFEKIENSRAMYVPGYNPSVFWAIGAEAIPLKKGYSSQDIIEYYDTREYRFRKKELLSELGNEIIGARGLLMCHFHRTDTYQHHYGDKDTVYNEQKLRRLYRETDELAGKIKETALDKGYDYIIFMSDHGLPTEEGHNENAFYSCNKELFGDETPHITDFHDKILELTGNGDKIESN